MDLSSSFYIIETCFFMFYSFKLYRTFIYLFYIVFLRCFITFNCYLNKVKNDGLQTLQIYIKNLASIANNLV